MKKYFILCIFIPFLFAGCNSDTYPNIVWKFKTGYPVKSVPVVAQGNVYIGSDKFYCLNAETGKLVWKFETFGTVDSSALIEKGHVYFQCGGLYCLDSATGELIWEFWPKQWLNRTTPAVAEGYVYAISKDTLYCIDSRNGQKRWETKISATYFSKILAFDGKIYIGGNGRIQCLNAETGNNTGYLNLGRGRLRPVLSNGRIYVSVMDKNLFCLDAKTRKMLWNYSADSIMASIPTVTDKYAYISAGKIICLDAKSGDVVWENSLNLPLAFAPIMVSEKHLYVRSPSKKIKKEDTHILKKRGPDLWITCLDNKTGKRLWESEAPVGSCAISEGYMYFGSKDYNVYCLQAKGES